MDPPTNHQTSLSLSGRHQSLTFQELRQYQIEKLKSREEEAKSQYTQSSIRHPRQGQQPLPTSISHERQKHRRQVPYHSRVKQKLPNAVLDRQFNRHYLQQHLGNSSGRSVAAMETRSQSPEPWLFRYINADAIEMFQSPACEEMKKMDQENIKKSPGIASLKCQGFGTSEMPCSVVGTGSAPFCPPPNESAVVSSFVPTAEVKREAIGEPNLNKGIEAIVSGNSQHNARPSPRMNAIRTMFTDGADGCIEDDRSALASDSGKYGIVHNAFSLSPASKLRLSSGGQQGQQQHHRPQPGGDDSLVFLDAAHQPPSFSSFPLIPTADQEWPAAEIDTVATSKTLHHHGYPGYTNDRLSVLAGVGAQQVNNRHLLLPDQAHSLSPYNQEQLLSRQFTPGVWPTTTASKITEESPMYAAHSTDGLVQLQGSLLGTSLSSSSSISLSPAATTGAVTAPDNSVPLLLPSLPLSQDGLPAPFLHHQTVPSQFLPMTAGAAAPEDIAYPLYAPLVMSSSMPSMPVGTQLTQSASGHREKQQYRRNSVPTELDQCQLGQQRRALYKVNNYDDMKSKGEDIHHSCCSYDGTVSPKDLDMRDYNHESSNDGDSNHAKNGCHHVSNVPNCCFPHQKDFAKADTMDCVAMAGQVQSSRSVSVKARNQTREFSGSGDESGNGSSSSSSSSSSSGGGAGNQGPTGAASAILQKQFEERVRKDQFLLEHKRAGLTYREIRQLGGFTEAESTLRGRHRTLTKPKEERVRKPTWAEHDDRLLRRAVRQVVRGRDATMGQVKISWKAVADFIYQQGGSYHFGNTTCRKRWDYILKRDQRE